MAEASMATRGIPAAIGRENDQVGRGEVGTHVIDGPDELHRT